MNDSIELQVRILLAEYVDVPVASFHMDADLERGYDMDSTELTELAKKLEQRFGAKATRSDRDDWRTGEHIAKFVSARVQASQAEAAAFGLVRA